MTAKHDLMHIYCKKGIKEMIARLADRNRRSMSSEVQYLIEQAHKKTFEEKKIVGRKPNPL
jgi:hypothetical protein